MLYFCQASQFYNVMTRKQIAELYVQSYPYIPDALSCEPMNGLMGQQWQHHLQMRLQSMHPAMGQQWQRTRGGSLWIGAGIAGKALCFAATRSPL